MLRVTLLVQSLIRSNQPRIALRMQLLPPSSSQPRMTHHVQLLLYCNWSMCNITPRATLSSVTVQTETPFLLLPLHFVASSLGSFSALLDSGAFCPH